jgi:hypothetical protein
MQIITTQLPQLPIQLQLNPELEEQRNGLALESRGVTIINTPELNDKAAISARSIRQFLKQVEGDRKDFTKPLADLAAISKAIVDELLQPLKDELARLEGLGTGWVLAERQRVEREEKQRQEDYQKAEQARQEAERKAQNATARAKTEAGEDLAVKAVDKANLATMKVQEVIHRPVAAVARSKGQSVKQVLKWELVDKAAAFAARPELFSVEIKPSAVQSTCVPEMPVPGLKLWWEDKVSFTTR